MAGKQTSDVETPVQAAPKVFNCPSCGVGVSIRALGHTNTVICESCEASLDLAKENYPIIARAVEKLSIKPLIPLGQRGKLHGNEWEVIGFMRRCDGTGEYIWSEYLLFNPTRGFRWLTEFGGHWNYVVTVKEKPKFGSAPRSVVKYMGKPYQLFHRGTAKVLYVVGEFYWRVKVGDVVNVIDYVAPPEILSSEQSKDEDIWSVGEYVPAEVVASAFKITKGMPYQSGVAPNQPSTVFSDLANIRPIWGMFVAILFLIQITTYVRSKNEQVYAGTYVYKTNGSEKIIVSRPFELKHGLANVDFKLNADIQNNWLELKVDLVNDETGTIYEFEQVAEYYSGYENDEAWSEGNRVSHVTLSSIPDGIYHLNIEAFGPKGNAWEKDWAYTDVSYSLTVTRDVVTWADFYWALALVSIVPLILGHLSHTFETKRWSTSD